MKSEVYAAADFITNLLRVGGNSPLSDLQMVAFRDTLVVMMRDHYQNHWFPEKPFKGSGYRCIRMNGLMDPLVAAAGQSCGLEPAFLRSLFPSELTMWVDPWEVSYRIGENGSICVLLDGKSSCDVSFDRTDACKSFGGDQWQEPASTCVFS